MGYGSYSLGDQKLRSAVYDTQTVNQVFTQRKIHGAMDPMDLTLRESRDSEEHPHSIPIIIALDVTGSMSYVPKLVLTEIMTGVVGKLIQQGLNDVQILFLGIGDHTCDRAPIQVGQFESSDELLEKWLKSVYLEGGGGGNEGESYILAHYVAANFTDHDAFIKRGQKGFLFTIGDEPPLTSISKESLKFIFGDGQYGDVSLSTCIADAEKKYNVYHIHVNETGVGRNRGGFEAWKKFLPEHTFSVESYKEITQIVADKVLQNTQVLSMVADSPVVEDNSQNVINKPQILL